MQSPWIHIIGAGVSGLSLACQLAKKGQLPGEVVISDPYLHNKRSQTFSFWFHEEDRQLLNPEHTWSKWSFSNQQQQLLHTGSVYQYGMVSGESFRKRALTQINRHPQIHLDERFIDERPIAKHVFDSRPPHVNHFYIKQSFVGFEIECEHHFDTEQVLLMDHMTHKFGGLKFRYVLPISADRLLVEYTVFTRHLISLDDLERESLVELQYDLKMKPFKHIRKERAHIPMGLNACFPSLGMPIGTRAGMSRDSTGYGFVEMQKWAVSASQSLVKQDRVAAYQVPTLRAWMDTCLLRLIEHRPDLTPHIFMELAHFLSGDQFAKFMTRCHLSDALSMVLKAPKKTFLCSAIGKPQWI